MKQIVTLSLGLFLGLAWATPGMAQLHTWTGVSDEDLFGESLAFIGDINADGHDDILIGFPYGQQGVPECFGGGSGVRVYSGLTGQTLYGYFAPTSAHLGRVVSAVGDWNGDGRPDFLIIQAPDYDCISLSSAARVYSGANGQLLATTSGGWTDLEGPVAAAAGDVNGDGFADVLLARPYTVGPVNPGIVWVWTGGPAPTLTTLVEGTAGSNQQVGSSVAGVGDWTGDGLDEVAVSTLNAWTRVYHVQSGTVVLEVPIAGTVSGGHDHDGDGFPDLLIVRGAPHHDARVYSGATGNLLTVLTGWRRYIAVGDLDGDGTGDYVVGDSSFDAFRGRVGIISGADGSLLMELRRGSAPNSWVGRTLAVGGDLNADGVADVLIGEYVSWVGRVTAHTGFAPPAPLGHCVGAPNSAGAGARLSWSGSWSLSTNHLGITVADCPPNHAGLFIYGTTAIQVPFGNGFRCVGGSVVRLSPVVSTGVTGSVSRVLDLAAHPLGSGPGQVSPGDTRHFQFWYRDIPAGGAQFNLSDALSFTFAN